MDRNEVILIRGLPGSGKSTLALDLLESSDPDCSHHFEADDFHIDSNGVYRYDATRITEAHDYCFMRFMEVLHDESQLDRLIVANTFSRRWEIQPYISVARFYDCALKILVPSTDWAWHPPRCYEHCVHEVPEAAIRSMLDRWESHDDSWLR